MKFELDPEIEGCEQGAVFFDESEALFISTNLSPHTVGEEIAIEQILLSANMKRAAWKVHDARLVPDEGRLAHLNTLRLQKHLPQTEQLEDSFSLNTLERLVQTAISSVVQREACAHKSLSLPPYHQLLQLLQQLQGTIAMTDPHKRWLAALNTDIVAKIRAIPKEQNFRPTDIACPYQPRVCAMLTAMSQGNYDINTLQVYDGYVLVPHLDQTYRWYSKDSWLTEE